MVHKTAPDIADSSADVNLSKMQSTESKDELNPAATSRHAVKLRCIEHLSEGTHSALQGAQRNDEAIEAFQTMLSKLENAPDAQIRRKS